MGETKIVWGDGVVFEWLSQCHCEMLWLQYSVGGTQGKSTDERRRTKSGIEKKGRGHSHFIYTGRFRSIIRLQFTFFQCTMTLTSKQK